VSKKPTTIKVLLIVSLVGIVIIWLNILFLRIEKQLDSFTFGLTTLFTLIYCGSTITKFFTKRILFVRIAYGIQFTSLMFLLPFSGESILPIFLLVGIPMVETSIYERFPYSIILESIWIVLLIVYQLLQLHLTGTGLGWDFSFSLLFILVLLNTSLIMMIKYREFLVWERSETMRMNEVVSKLTQVNLEYQDYALDIQETATEQERNRITREIHDIVGYTLTNTIMMMEAAIDMAKRNPMGISALINTTRTNALEGLEETRRALYKLRESQIERPKGMFAVLRMIKTYSKATAVKVDVLWDGVPWYFDEDRNRMIFSTIQQGLINAFIHGKATKALVRGTINEQILKVSVQDNGRGALEIPVKEGIGLRGVRERLDRIGGWIQTQNILDGFELNAMIPLEPQTKTKSPNG